MSNVGYHRETRVVISNETLSCKVLNQYHHRMVIVKRERHLSAV